MTKTKTAPNLELAAETLSNLKAAMNEVATVMSNPLNAANPDRYVKTRLGTYEKVDTIIGGTDVLLGAWIYAFGDKVGKGRVKAARLARQQMNSGDYAAAAKTVKSITL